MRYYSWVFLLLMMIPINGLQAQHVRTDHWRERNQGFISELDTIKPGRIVFIGNSITEGFDLGRFFPHSNPINRGISGDHIDGLLERLETSVIRLKPSRLYVMIGINDIGAGDPDSLIMDNYRRLTAALGHSLPDSTVYFNSILPTTALWSNCPVDKIVRLNKKLRSLVKTFGFNWIDLYPLFDDGTGHLRAELTRDGLHLNETGYRVWVQVLEKTGLR
jgi:hypothetical protein